MSLKNLSAVLIRQKKKLSLLNLDVPELNNGYVLVKMKFAGICHTQLNEISGILGKDKFLPHCMGHEGVGEIIKVGKGVSKFKIGDKVVVSWIRKKDKKTYGPAFFHYEGKKINTGGCNTLMQYSLVSANRVFKMSQNNKYFRESTLLGCALPTASNAILNVAKIKKNSRVLIMGMGGLGYSSLLVLNYIKCKDIVCIDNNLKRLNLTSKSVNTNFKEINDSNIEKFLKNNYEKFDYVIDCTGSKKLIQKTHSLCKKFSGKFIIIGNTKINERVSLKTWDFIFGKTITGAWGDDGTFMKNFKLNEKILINQIKNVKKILPKKNYNISEINTVVNNFFKGKILRPIIKF